jgi:hypothetical protein
VKIGVRGFDSKFRIRMTTRIDQLTPDRIRAIACGRDSATDIATDLRRMIQQGGWSMRSNAEANERPQASTCGKTSASGGTLSDERRRELLQAAGFDDER